MLRKILGQICWQTNAFSHHKPYSHQLYIIPVLSNANRGNLLPNAQGPGIIWCVKRRYVRAAKEKKERKGPVRMGCIFEFHTRFAGKSFCVIFP